MGHVTSLVNQIKVNQYPVSNSSPVKHTKLYWNFFNLLFCLSSDSFKRIDIEILLLASLCFRNNSKKTSLMFFADLVFW